MKYLLSSLFLVYSALVYSETFPAPYVTPSNIQWSNDSLPKEIASNKTYKEWLNKNSGENTPIRWSTISLTSDRNEILIQEQVGGSGGLGTIVFQKSEKNWNKLVEIFGGFIFYPAPSKNHTLVIYEKTGSEYYRTELQYNGKTYIKKSSYEVPIELTRLNNSPIDFYKYYWFMNGKELKK